MLTVEMHNGFRDVQQVKATRVVVYDMYDNPLAIVVQAPDDPRVCQAVTCDQPGFQTMLKAMGLDKTVVVATQAPPDLSRMRFDE